MCHSFHSAELFEIDPSIAKPYGSNHLLRMWLDPPIPPQPRSGDMVGALGKFVSGGPFRGPSRESPQIGGSGRSKHSVVFVKAGACNGMCYVFVENGASVVAVLRCFKRMISDAVLRYT